MFATLKIIFNRKIFAFGENSPYLFPLPFHLFPLPQVGIPNVEQLVHPLRVTVQIQLSEQCLKSGCSSVFCDGSTFRRVFAVSEVASAFIGCLLRLGQVRKHSLKRFALCGRLDVSE